MKKIIYIILLAISTSLIFSSCTEEEVAPATETLSNGGGAHNDGNGGEL